MPEAVRAADIHQQAEHGHAVTDDPDEGRRAGNRFILLQANQVDNCTQRESASAQGNRG